MAPDSDGDVMLRFADGSESGYVKAAALHKATPAEWAAAKASARPAQPAAKRKLVTQ